MVTLFVPKANYKLVIQLLRAQSIKYKVDPIRGNSCFYITLDDYPKEVISHLLESQYNCYFRSNKQMTNKQRGLFGASKTIRPFILLLLLLTVQAPNPSQAGSPTNFISSPRKVERSPEAQLLYDAYKERMKMKRYNALVERKRQYDFKQEMKLFRINPAFYSEKMGNTCSSRSSGCYVSR